jgi:hypothetical protein
LSEGEKREKKGRRIEGCGGKRERKERSFSGKTAKNKTRTRMKEIKEIKE